MLTKYAQFIDHRNGVWTITAGNGSVDGALEFACPSRLISPGEGVSIFLEKHPELRVTAMALDRDNVVLVTEPKPTGVTHA